MKSFLKSFLVLALLGTLATAGSASAAEIASVNQPKADVMPVLVQVDATGKVTYISPSQKLTPRYQELLTKNIKELITGPATFNNRAVSSQFVMNMALTTSPRPDGNYDVRFIYAWNTPVPAGPKHWDSGYGNSQLGTFETRADVGPRSWPVPRQSTYPSPGSRP